MLVRPITNEAYKYYILLIHILSIEMGPSLLHPCPLLVSLGLSPVQSEVVTNLYLNFQSLLSMVQFKSEASKDMKL